MTVVDASVVVRLLQAHKDDDLLRRRIVSAGRKLSAPAHLDVEVLSAVAGMVKGGKIGEDRARRMAGQYEALRINRYDVAPFGTRLLTLRHNFTVYDAAYVALAEVLEQPLLTCDAKFARAPRGTHRAEIHTYPA
ncbi:putative nucleic acid-binding protein [Haloactinopolyspora alba]|uniref:Ribonuclease VapC n=1 Tax=Haloactinopolyspora alba TaxID=648780 RepID=A0A2P8EBK6_9ACTN|nr:type II toxin-antitoxin system VapC family toxin [Haloactinopolyspora alba]PSL06855.1 putative nucleic acid-binding protein [Haloactinopolyspora alba]